MDMEQNTKGVDTLLGNPRKAILAMSVPLIIAMIAQSANNLIDAVWVAGLGPDALAAVGFIFPLFFILIGIGNGVGIGASSAIARHIGRGDKVGVDSTATQSIVLITIFGALMTVFMLVFQRDLLVMMGTDHTIDLCVEYGTPIFAMTLLFFFNGLLSNLLRSEGAAKRAMVTQVLAALINIILDPFFIYDYGLGMGMAGAAWATIVAVAISFTLIFFWFFIKRDTYIKISVKHVRLEKATVYDILRVGIPASLEMIVMSLFSIVVNLIIVMSDRGTDGLAIFSSTWRIVQMLMIPNMAIGGAVVPVFAAAYGARRFDKIKEAYFYALKVCTVIMTVLVIITLITADWMVMLFAYSDSVAVLKDDMASCLRILSLFLPFMSWGFVGAGLFQSMGLGLYSFICTVVRNGLQIPAAWILLVTVGTTVSITWGISSMEILGSIIGGLWSLLLLRSIIRKHPASKNLAQ
ncbi:MAG: MATE family efflux transporter [Candidatus Methanomethylophilaceae archaeon]|nr:MATE family efflux transporter [Candidatus Methanomethylophilaceae archaeon]